ncbi:hypothetical protein K7X08_003209 [Anisodus acutangulus]|uniref:Uncharacterized protein n=1 Tax=Anisodus acutangulus TaxID=402998 RepID=A0A9Q1MEY1_9SOLA|nr:hypothetical protein K7X08_003209 [Anisodus acutangulus]
MKATAVAGQESSLVTDYVLTILEMDICAAIMVGDEMRRGISGGQKKRLTTGEMLVGPAKVFFMDEISTGLDSSTTFQIVKYMRQMVHIMDVTMIISLLQPAPETYDLFDDIILLSEGKIIYQGPRENVLEFFESVGFKCLEGKELLTFLSEFAERFSNFHVGQQLFDDLGVPYDKSKAHPAALVTEKYERFFVLPSLGFCSSHLAFKNSPFFCGITDMDRTYLLTIGFAPDATRCFREFLAYFALHQSALSLFRFIGALGRTQVVASTCATFTILIVFVLGGFIIAKGVDDLEPWMQWGYYISPMTYGQNAIAINEFLDKRWSTPNNGRRFSEPTVGKVLLKARSMYTEDRVFWLCVVALFAFLFLFNFCFILALTYLNPLGDSRSVISDDEKSKKKKRTEQSSLYSAPTTEGQDSDIAMDVGNTNSSSNEEAKKRGMVLPFQPLSLAFNHMNYYVDIPAEMKAQGVDETRLQLLRDVSGRKTEGSVEGSINISGYPKNQSTFARISAWLCLSPDVNRHTRKNFVEEVMELVELNPLRDSLVGLPGVDGLSTEQRKRLTIAVELVATPSIIFMDEQTSGLDARAAAIVMRAVRNTVDTGTTVVCTIHQPSIDIFEAFDESVPGVPRIEEGTNPATWMLDISATAVEAQLQVVFADIYANSELYRRNQELIKELTIPAPGSQDLHFPTGYSQLFFEQCKACFWKQHLSYWRHPQYNAIRFAMTTVIGVIFGIIFWNKGNQLSKQQDLLNIIGATYAAVMFLGGTNTSAMQSVVSVARTVFYREKAAGMYSALHYAFAQVVIETIYIAIQTFIYSLILYAMIGFHWSAGKFFLFYFFVFMCFVYFTMYGMMLVALTPNYHIASIVISFFLSFWNLFSGFLIPRTEIPIWWSWYYWASPVAWTIYGLVRSQVGDKNNLIEIPGGGEVSLELYLKDSYGFESNGASRVESSEGLTSWPSRVDGLSTEQRKRLTIAVELVATPSIIFMDEQTSGLDARAAAIVMRAVRNTVDTGTTVVCTIHQPSIDIFEAFDESVPGVPRIEEGTNPATWMLDISATAVEAQLQVVFADIYANSELYRRNQELIKELTIPAPGSQDLHFPTGYSQLFFEQCKACFWKQHLSYWRHPQYNAIRFAMTTVIGVIFGIIFWNKGNQLSKQQDLLNIIGATYAAVMFLGGTNTSAMQSVVSVARTVFYREKAAGMYSALHYAFAQVVIETIYIAIQTFIYSLILYAMIGFHWSAGKFFLFYFFVFMCFVYFTMYGMMLVALTPNYHIASIVISFFLSFWNLFSGFLIPRTEIPIWWSWYYWASPVAWTIYGLVRSQVGDKNNLIEIPGGGEVSLELYLKDSYGFEYDFLGVVDAVPVSWAVLFCFIFAYAIKFFNVQRR